VKDILQHVIDNERIFCYRALRFARNDKTQCRGTTSSFSDNMRTVINDLLMIVDRICNGPSIFTFTVQKLQRRDADAKRNQLQ